MAAITLDQMRIFLAVAEQLHVTRAAETLYMTQSSVSAAIQTVEAAYGVKLFDRVGRHIEITEAGRLLQSEATAILEHVALTERGLRELNNLQRGELRVGASMIVGNYWLPAKLCQFQRQYPGIVVTCTLGNAAAIAAGTALGNFDLGLVTQTSDPPFQRDLESEIIANEPLHIVVGRSHPWFERSDVRLDELSTTDWVMREPGSGVQQVFEQAIQQWGVDPAQLNAVLVLNSSEMVKTVVEGGVGAAAIPEVMVTKELRFATLHQVPVLDTRAEASRKLEIVQPIWKLRHKKRFQTKIAIAFEQILLSKD